MKRDRNFQLQNIPMKNIMRSLSLIFFLLATIGYAQMKKPMVASDLMKITTANQIQISPDGGKAVMVVTRKAVKMKTNIITHGIFICLIWRAIQNLYSSLLETKMTDSHSGRQMENKLRLCVPMGTNHKSGYCR